MSAEDPREFTELEVIKDRLASVEGKLDEVIGHLEALASTLGEVADKILLKTRMTDPGAGSRKEN